MVWNKETKAKHPLLYECDPAKNIECDKLSCHTKDEYRGCFLTHLPELAKEGARVCTHAEASKLIDELWQEHKNRKK